MTHFHEEAHLSTLSNAIKRMSPEERGELLRSRAKAIQTRMQSTCWEERYEYGLPERKKK